MRHPHARIGSTPPPTWSNPAQSWSNPSQIGRKQPLVSRHCASCLRTHSYSDLGRDQTLTGLDRPGCRRAPGLLECLSAGHSFERGEERIRRNACRMRSGTSVRDLGVSRQPGAPPHVHRPAGERPRRRPTSWQATACVFLNVELLGWVLDEIIGTPMATQGPSSDSCSSSEKG